MKHAKGGILLVGVLVITTVLWILSKGSLQLFQEASPLLLVSQIAALLGAILFSATFLLSSRTKAIEQLFGSLESAYTSHKNAGRMAAVLLILHLLLLVGNALPNSELAQHFLFETENPPFIFGQLALYSLIATIIVTIYIRVQYRLWRIVHKLLGVSAVFALLHIATIYSDTSIFLPLKVWMLFWVALGTGAWIYKAFFYAYSPRKRQYKVKNVEQIGNVAVITMMPQGNKLNYTEGQYAFFRFHSVTLPTEPHPFTIISSPANNELKIAVKSLGDFTSEMNAVQNGDSIDVWGPHGVFGKEYSNQTKEAVWIAGGIGVTPFISLLTKQNHPQKTTLHYCTRTSGEAVFHDQFIDAAKTREDFTYLQRCTNETGRLSAEDAVKGVSDIKNTQFYLCGPKGMIQAMQASLMRLGAKKENIIFEEFDFKST